MDSPVTFNFLSVQEGFIERKCDGAARLHRRKKRHCFTQMFITSKLHYWYTSDQCQPNIFGGQTVYVSLRERKRCYLHFHCVNCWVNAAAKSL